MVSGCLLVFSSFVYICIAIGDPVIKTGGFHFNPATFLCPSQGRTWNSNVICRVSLCVQYDNMRSVCLVDIGELDYHNCLNFLFMIMY